MSETGEGKEEFMNGISQTGSQWPCRYSQSRDRRGTAASQRGTVIRFGRAQTMAILAGAIIHRWVRGRGHPYGWRHHH
jgi:hypothetical protein